MIDITDCKNISDVARKYYGTATGGNRRKAKRLLIKNRIDPDEGSNQNKEENEKKEIARRVENPPEIAKKIYELRDRGYCYREIAKELNCSKATVAYWCGEGQKEKSKNRKLRLEDGGLSIIRRCDHFKNSRNPHNYNKVLDLDGDRKLRKAVSFFCKRSNMKNGGSREVIKKFGYVTKCYLTGREIDLRKDNGNADHIVPVSKGGDGSLDNFGITIPEVNAMKSDLTVQEFLDLCEEVLRYNRPELFKD